MYEYLARYYDQIHSSLTADLPFILKLAQENGGPILDLGCGTGRLLFPLAQAGFPVVGVDNSPLMLAVANKRLAAQPEEVRALVTLWKKDMRSLVQDQTETKFTLALFSFNTLLHMREGEILGLLKRIAGLLTSGGKIFIDLENPFLLAEIVDQNEAVFETSFMDAVTSKRVEQWSQSSLDSNTQTLTVTWQFRTQEKEPGTTIVEIVYHYLYPHQIALLLQLAGFRLLQISGSYEGEPFQEDSERLLLLADLPG
jgi:SAM-dependent methyltransferase